MSVNSEVNVTYNDSDGKGDITLIDSHLSKNGVYARVDRSIVTTENLIARASKKESGVRPHMMWTCAKLFKEELLEALSRGESVSFLGVGTFYPAPVGTKGTTPETASVEGFRVRCTVSRDANDAVSKLKVNKVSKQEYGPVIDTMTDVATGKTDGTFVAMTSMRIEGDRLKIGGENGGVFFAPVGEETGIADEALWIKAETFIINEPMTLALLLPKSLEAGKKYCVIVKTNTSKNGATKKSYSTTIGSYITIVQP